MNNIYVTKPYLPKLRTYNAYVKKIFKSGVVTNNGPLVQELEYKLCEYLGVQNLLLVANGTLALQIAYRLLARDGMMAKAITTPFSFIASASFLRWEQATVKFADIDKKTLCIDPSKVDSCLELLISAIVPVHVFGNVCDTEEIERVSKKLNTPIIYDASHAFGVRHHNTSVFNYGDISCCSLHATKLFNTAEGGFLVIKDDALYQKARKIINFGINTDTAEIETLGINAKMSELSAAMGLAMFNDIPKILFKRKKINDYYQNNLYGSVEFPVQNPNSTQNHSYFPVIFKTTLERQQVENNLKKVGVIPRRYFYPSLDTVEYFKSSTKCPISRDISGRILCLPIYPSLKKKDCTRILNIIHQTLKEAL